MKLGMYLRQAWYGLRANRVYSAVFIIGTAFSMALVMAFLTVLSARVVNTRPEMHRDRTMVIYNVGYSSDAGGMSGMVSSEVGNVFLEGLPEVERWTTVYGGSSMMIENMEGDARYAYTVFTDLDFWKIFDMDFLYGGPVSDNGMDVNTPEAVISESFAVRLLGRADAVGEKIVFKEKEFKVCGVVRDVPMSAVLAFSEVWLPSSVYEASAQRNPKCEFLGGGTVVALLHGSRDFAGVEQAVRDKVAVYNSNSGEMEGWTLDISGMSSYRQYLFAWSELSPSAYAWLGLGVVLLVLLVPLINLSGMVNSRMEARLPEFGTRKAFGANARSITVQIVWENLLMTFIGGVLGLLLSWLMIGIFSRQLNALVPGVIVDFYTGRIPDAAYFDFRNFFDIRLYLVMMLIILVLNLLSAIIPAMNVVRNPIAESLNRKKQ